MTKLKALEQFEFQFHYYDVISKFNRKEFSASLRRLSRLKRVDNLPKSWETWIRILRILCRIELGEIDQVEYDVESLRKYYERLEADYYFKKRDGVIIKILLALVKHEFNFEKVATNEEERVRLLKQTKGDYRWYPKNKNPEMILFHDWFDCKRLNKAYAPNFGRYFQEEH